MDELIVEGLNLIIHDTVAYIALFDFHISTDFLNSSPPTSPTWSLQFSSLDSMPHSIFKMKMYINTQKPDVDILTIINLKRKLEKQSPLQYHQEE